MIAFCIQGRYDNGDGSREYCYDQDSPAFIVRWRKWATDEWTVEQRLDLPSTAGLGLLNALAHAHPRQALLVAEFVRAHGPIAQDTA